MAMFTRETLATGGVAPAAVHQRTCHPVALRSITDCSIDPHVRSNAERSHCAQSAAALYRTLEIVHQSVIW